jgi:hypothetical protein
MSVYVSATSEIHAEGLAIVEFEKKYGGKADRAIFIRWLTQAEYTQIQKQEQERQEQARQERERQERERQQEQARRQAYERQERELANQQPEKHEQQDFYGTWYTAPKARNDPSITITITNNELRADYSDGDYFYMSIDRWRVGYNPPGYTLYGRVSRRSNNIVVEPPLHIYLLGNGKGLKWSFQNYNQPGNTIFVKQ